MKLLSVFEVRNENPSIALDSIDGFKPDSCIFPIPRGAKGNIYYYT
jgi:hypothetical protein